MHKEKEGCCNEGENDVVAAYVVKGKETAITITEGYKKVIISAKELLLVGCRTKAHLLFGKKEELDDY